MPMDRGQTRSSEQGLESPRAEHSLLGSFAASALDAGLQRPVNGISQLAGILVDKQLPELHLVDPAKPSSGAEGYVQQARGGSGYDRAFFDQPGCYAWSSWRPVGHVHCFSRCGGRRHGVHHGRHSLTRGK